MNRSDDISCLIHSFANMRSRTLGFTDSPVAGFKGGGSASGSILYHDRGNSLEDNTILFSWLLTMCHDTP